MALEHKFYTIITGFDLQRKTANYLVLAGLVLCFRNLDTGSPQFFCHFQLFCFGQKKILFLFSNSNFAIPYPNGMGLKYIDYGATHFQSTKLCTGIITQQC